MAHKTSQYTATFTGLPCLTSVREIYLALQRLDMPWLVDTPVDPMLFGEIKGVRDEGVCKVDQEMEERGIYIN